MRAVVVQQFHPTDPAAGAAALDVEPPRPPDGWVRVRVEAASLNHHDVWSLRGSGCAPSSCPSCWAPTPRGCSTTTRR
ncbi:hypothetical protein [Litorihabitans aurantiacus]|uniref:hypothetical protein n=1 Tax=Litorihabitans aurantiacus TaxID=1930061 RepID=UPI0024E0FF49|nr:hypothetical protein [Litorihabitans aurantiacus]